MNITPKISIILPTHNGGEWIKKAIQSVLAQSFTDFEFIIINDDSIDDTEEIIKSFSENETRIKYIKNEENLGIQKTLNRGLKEAKGKYIARIDDDDEWIDRDKLKKQVEFLNNNSDYVLVGTGTIIVDSKNTELSKYLMPQTDKEIRNSILLKNCFLHSSVIFKKDKAMQFNGYSESLETKHIEDYDLWLKLGAVGKFANLNTYSVSLKQDNNTISAKNRINQARKSIGEIRKFKNKYPNFLIGYLLSYMRLFFFLTQKVIPLNDSFLYKIKTIYKKL